MLTVLSEIFPSESTNAGRFVDKTFRIRRFVDKLGRFIDSTNCSVNTAVDLGGGGVLPAPAPSSEP